VNPHFLFNALNTLKAVIRRDSDQAAQLVQYLSTFFRKNLKRPSEIVTLADEIEHVNAYLQIEQARFQSRCSVVIRAGRAGVSASSGFTLQPIVENAIKHGFTAAGHREITIAPAVLIAIWCWILKIMPGCIRNCLRRVGNEPGG
jgi:two-component system LytT family sensor kinase